MLEVPTRQSRIRSSTLDATLSLISSRALLFSRARATSTKSRMIWSTSLPTKPTSVNLVASTLMNGARASLASRRATSVFPQPVGPIIKMFFGDISSLSGDATRCLRQRLRIATATARLASGCPMMYRSSCSTISFGRSAFSSATSADSSSGAAAAGSSMVTFTDGCAAALWHARTRWMLAMGDGPSPLAAIRLRSMPNVARRM
mmetsp:Transcript_15095/g.30528  ORF Transcript_15095/g.30528 Transcript_15095/m.30528 type:complete len:204 (-) Transcript_15095:37-648(-)